MNSKQDKLRITEIFHSLQGEAATVGLPTVFVRLTGCPLRCQYCDTAYAFKGGSLYTLDAILEKIKDYNCKYVCVTGGEPLAQQASKNLLTKLCDHGYNTSIETSGALPIEAVDKRVNIVLDIKTPGSLEANKNLYSNFQHLKATDQIKFVICSEADYTWTKSLIEKHKLTERFEVLLSPSYNEIEPAYLAELILRDKLQVRFQIQLHKILWNDAKGR